MSTVNAATQTAQRKKRKKRMRLPNGIGSVHLIGDGKARRKPWRARVPAGIDFNEATGRATQKYITIGYFENETDAIEALFEYRKDPYTPEAATVTFAELFDLWKGKNYPGFSISNQKAYNSAFKNSTPLHPLKMREIKTGQLDKVMDELQGGYQVQVRLKSFWGQLFKFALERDIVTKNYAEFVKVRDKDTGTKRTDIAAEDIAKLWQAIDAGDRDAAIVMIYIYTGLRPSELLEIKKTDVDLAGRIMIGGMKTEAGQNRHIPIHKCIMPFIERLMQTEGEYLVMRYNKKKPSKLNYVYWLKFHWAPLIERLDITQYTPHYTRHTCSTMMRVANIEEDIRKLILGHKTTDITDRYTHIPDTMLIAAIDTVPGRS